MSLLPELSVPANLPGLVSIVKRMWEELRREVNGRIGFGSVNRPENVRGFMFSGVTPGVANTEFTVTHNLGVLPNGFIVLSQDQAAILYSSRVANWTTSQIFLKCNTTSVNIVIFIS